MNTRIIMSASALVMAALGLIASFLPQEVLQYLGTDPTGMAPVLVQILGALYLGFAILNWMAKGVLIGGIYARPLAMGNMLHFFAGAMALLKGLQAGQQNSIIWALALVYGLMAVLFGLIAFRHPLAAKVAGQ
ncbi:hypothetical protein ACFSC6_07505 [Rufibacter sediminis]|uniref:Uncharacterized protein n=1 Tax=Rufibacter sediminis TaxID=2762756 RepID=A0ABR6VPV4_9BACT|nr:hypothetical protein [Rufibacter sediminis]MBC3539187.1 hypothetical protein [Rufibacter sediminis]